MDNMTRYCYHNIWCVPNALRYSSLDLSEACHERLEQIPSKRLCYPDDQIGQAKMKHKSPPTMESAISLDIVDVTNMKANKKAMGASSKCKVDKFGSIDVEWIDKISECPVYRPSKEEFEVPFVYLQNIAPDASKHVIALISSIPVGIVLKEARDFKFTTKVQTLWLAEWGTNDKVNFFMRGREFWKDMARGKKRTVEYGVNVDGSAFSCALHDQLGRSKWNLKISDTSTPSQINIAIVGNRNSVLIIITFCAPKTLYGVPSHAAPEFEKVVQHYVYSGAILSTSGKDGAFGVLMDKPTMFPPNILLQQDAPVYKAVQLPGEFIITFPRSYHAGFSHGPKLVSVMHFFAGCQLFLVKNFSARKQCFFQSLQIRKIVPLWTQSLSIMSRSLLHA
ncbi:hypothetical protein TEA_026090 [Camellia sinensis var. sinensis]|uniref:JmjC domain-containing protein n=1 Tax=Camellia sinensis var. sinensis TaxID=542762 RepID=A0A4S4D3U9_CAMSN|nr:hypothetical protein TEA_026090 [Camellia sinensis var. sinensis]